MKARRNEKGYLMIGVKEFYLNLTLLTYKSLNRFS